MVAVGGCVEAPLGEAKMAAIGLLSSPHSLSSVVFPPTIPLRTPSSSPETGRRFGAWNWLELLVDLFGFAWLFGRLVVLYKKGI